MHVISQRPAVMSPLAFLQCRVYNQLSIQVEIIIKLELSVCCSSSRLQAGSWLVDLLIGWLEAGWWIWWMNGWKLTGGSDGWMAGSWLVDLLDEWLEAGWWICWMNGWKLAGGSDGWMAGSWLVDLMDEWLEANWWICWMNGWKLAGGSDGWMAGSWLVDLMDEWLEANWWICWMNGWKLAGGSVGWKAGSWLVGLDGWLARCSVGWSAETVIGCTYIHVHGSHCKSGLVAACSAPGAVSLVVEQPRRWQPLQVSAGISLYCTRCCVTDGGQPNCTMKAWRDCCLRVQRGQPWGNSRLQVHKQTNILLLCTWTRSGDLLYAGWYFRIAAAVIAHTLD